MKYFNDQNEYKEPILIKFDAPKVIKLHELRKFLDYYKPFPCADVYAYQEFSYGDFDNHVSAVLSSATIDVSFSKKKDDIDLTYFCTQKAFWHYNKNKPFWKEELQLGYNSPRQALASIFDVEIEIDGVYVISWHDKSQMEGK